MLGSGIESQLVRLCISNELIKILKHIGFAAFYQQTLSCHPPKHIITFQGLSQLFGDIPAKTDRVLRLGTGVNQAIDTAVATVAQRIFIGITFTAFGIITAAFFRGSGIVLHNKVIPVGNPERTIRTYFGLNRGDPLVMAGKDIPAVFFSEAGPAFFDNRPVGKSPGRFTHKSNTVPVLLRELPGCTQSKAGIRSKSHDQLRLAVVAGDAVHGIMAVDLLSASAPSLPFGPLGPLIIPVIALRDAHIYDVRIIGS